MAREAARLLRKALAAEMKARRIDAGISQIRAYQSAGITKNVYQRLEAGERDAKFADVVLIAKALGAGLGEFVTAVAARADAMDSPVPHSVEEYRATFGFDPADDSPQTGP